MASCTTSYNSSKKDNSSTDLLSSSVTMPTPMKSLINCKSSSSWKFYITCLPFDSAAKKLVDEELLNIKNVHLLNSNLLSDIKHQKKNVVCKNRLLENKPRIHYWTNVLVNLPPKWRVQQNFTIQQLLNWKTR